MHLLVTLAVVVGGVLTLSLPQYQPLRSLQHHYEVPPAGYSTGLDATRPVQGHRPVYTYAEVNTPYYQYHYYSPVYKNHRNQPQLFAASPPLPSLPPNAFRASTSLKNLFYTPTTTAPLFSPQSGFQNSVYSPGGESSVQLFSPKFANPQEVSITTKPFTVNNPFTPMFRPYQEPISNNVNPSPIAPVSTPTELAAEFPNILRETYGNDRDPDTPLIHQAHTLEPDLTVPTNLNSDIVFKSSAVPESLATPSSTIVKDDLRRRGISPQLENRDQIPSYPIKPSLDQSSLSTETVTSTLFPQFDTPVEESSRTSFSNPGSGEISANVLRVFSSPNLEFMHNYTFNSSVVLPTDLPLTELSTKDANNSSDLFIQPISQVSTQTPTRTTTVSHLQKIAKKIDPTVASKKISIKHPNVLFYSPGHDIPK